MSNHARVLLLGGGGAERRALYTRGEVPHELPYGAELLRAHGFTPMPATESFPKWLNRPKDIVEHRWGARVATPLRAVPSAVQAQATLALSEMFLPLPTAFRRRHLPPYSKSPIAGFVCWATETFASQRGQHFEVMQRALRDADRLFVWSGNQRPILSSMFGLKEEKITAVLLGVDTEFFDPGNLSDANRAGVLSVGQDRGRDFATLFAAASDATWCVDVVSAKFNIDGLQIPDNVNWHAKEPFLAYRERLRTAAVVVVPTHASHYPTGSTVLLEAMAMGCACVATDSPALREHATDDCVSFVPPHDPDALRRAVTDLVDNTDRRNALGAAARRHVLEHHRPEQTWGVVAEHLADLVDGTR